MWREINYLKLQIWSCSFLMYMMRIFCAIWREIRYRKQNFLFKAKISWLFNVLRTWDYLHFLTYMCIFRKLKGNYLTNEIGKRTLTIHNCPISPHNDAQDWQVYKITTTKCKNAKVIVYLRFLNVLSIICANDSFQFVTCFYLWLIYWVRIF